MSFPCLKGIVWGQVYLLQELLKYKTKQKTPRDLHEYPVVLHAELLKAEILCRPEKGLLELGFSKDLSIFSSQLPKKMIFSMNCFPVVNGEYFGL